MRRFRIPRVAVRCALVRPLATRIPAIHHRFTPLALRYMSSWPLPSTGDKCVSCGSALQSEDPRGLGYFVPKQLAMRTKPEKKSAQDALLSSREKLILQENMVQYIRGPTVKEEPEKQMKCKRCHDAIHKHKWTETDATKVHKPEVIDRMVPRRANIVYVVNSLDFPLSVNASLLADRSPANVYYVVTKLDKLYSNNTAAIHKRALPYFAKVLHRIVGAKKERVFLASAKKGWFLRGLVNSLPAGDIYIVGEVNSGKSTLVRALTQRTEEKEKAHADAVSHLPGFTRDKMALDLGNGTKLIDTPGFVKVSKTLIENSSAADLKELMDAPTVTETSHLRWDQGVAEKHFNGKQVLSVGGLFYLRPPVDTVLQVKMGISAPLAKFRDIEKAKEVCESRPEALKQKFVVAPESATKLARFVVPPFHGSVDVVVGGVGYVKLIPTGARNARLFEIFAPSGTRIAIRDCIHKYLYKFKDRQGQTYTREIPDHEIFSELQPVAYDLPADLVASKLGRDRPSHNRVYDNSQWIPLNLD